MPDETEHRPEGEVIADHVERTCDYLRTGKTTRNEAVKVKSAAERAIMDHDVNRSLTRVYP